MILAAGELPSLDARSPTVLVGGALAAGGANTINCWIERDRDQVMRRTAHRPLPSGQISPERALVFGLLLEVAAFALLWSTVNLLSAVLAVSATLFYVFVYTIWLKPRSPQNIVIGGAAGAVPVLVGWASVTGELVGAGVGAVRDRVLLDPAALLGAVAALLRRLRGGRHPDAAGGEGRRRRAPRDRSSTASSSFATTLVLPLVADTGMHLPRRRDRARASCSSCARCASCGHSTPERAIKFFTLSNIYLASALCRHCRRHSRPLRLTARAVAVRAVAPRAARRRPGSSSVVVLVVGGDHRDRGHAEQRREAGGPGSNGVAEANSAKVGRGGARLRARRRSTAGRSASRSSAVEPVVLNFWASWCTPCREEFPMFRDDARRQGR